jgi:hypothetical protein
MRLGAPFHLTWSCYGESEMPAGSATHACLRQKGFREAGVEDPIVTGSAADARCLSRSRDYDYPLPRSASRRSRRNPRDSSRLLVLEARQRTDGASDLPGAPRSPRSLGSCWSSTTRASSARG